LTHQLTNLDALLLTHHHFDHIAGIDDLRPLTERHGTMRIYGRSDTLAHVRKVFSYAFSQESQGSSRPSLELVTIDGMFQLDGVAIQPIEVLHGTMPINAYRIGNLAYVTDASAIPPHSLEMLRGVEVLVINALRYAPHPTHFSLEESLAVIADIRPEQAYLVHLTHAFEHATVQEQLPERVMLAYDGLQVTLGARDHASRD
jgi:phosphoribosyl 1,2-cyclic phosphate phosphodiesterase